jgi:transmembrane sensor
MSDMDWDLLIRYLAGACTDAERVEVDQWLAASSEHRHILDGIQAAIAQSRRELTTEEKGAMLASLQREIAGAGSEGSARPPLEVVRGGPTHTPVFGLPPRRRPWLLRVSAIAAGVLLAVGVGTTWRLSRHATPLSPTYSVISTTRGQRLSVRLADGTLVTLAPGTTLRTPSTYGRPDRRVQLEGEAAFTVTHDSTRPFAVQTKRAVTRDVGTRFVLRAYADESDEHVAVAEGSVAVGPGQPGGADVVLGKSDVAQVSAKGEVKRVPGAALDSYFAWTEGRLVFRRATLGDAAEQLGRWYDIEVQLGSPKLGALRFTAAFGPDETAPQVLGVIAKALNLDVTQSGRTYRLRAK